MKVLKIERPGLINIYVLYRMVLKFVYAPHEMSNKEIDMMTESLIGYRKGIKWAQDNDMMGTIDEEIEINIKAMEEILREDKSGELDEQKELFRKHNIDYRKFHRLPEAYTPEDFIKGAEALKETMKQNPQDYEKEK